MESGIIDISVVTAHATGLNNPACYGGDSEVSDYADDHKNDISTGFLAKKAGVATGTVYNYFTNKDEILLALTEEYWRQALLEVKTVVKAGSFCAQVQEIFTFLKERIDQSAGKLMSSLGNVETAGQARMVSMQSAFETVFVRCMEQDADIRGDIWDEGFTREQFARFIMMNMVLLLKSEAPDMDFFIRIIRRTIY